MTSLRVLGIINIILLSITMLIAVDGTVSETSMGFWVLLTFAVSLALSIVAIIKSKN